MGVRGEDIESVSRPAAEGRWAAAAAASSASLSSSDLLGFDDASSRNALSLALLASEVSSIVLLGFPPHVLDRLRVRVRVRVRASCCSLVTGMLTTQEDQKKEWRFCV